jgi:hypothetical protein
MSSDMHRAMTRRIKNIKFTTQVKAILAEEKMQLRLWTRPAKLPASSS